MYDVPSYLQVCKRHDKNTCGSNDRENIEPAVSSTLCFALAVNANFVIPGPRKENKKRREEESNQDSSPN